MHQTLEKSSSLERLLSIMRQLRHPEDGCPWDLEQDFRSLIPFVIEEAYEVAEAAQNGTEHDLRGELGDLLLQVVFYAQIAAEDNLFDFDDVARSVSEKMIDRHPHIFADTPDIKTAGDVERIWEDRKEKQAKRTSAMDDIAGALPALIRAQKIQKRAAREGFEWQDASHIFAKMEEEIGEVQEAIDQQEGHARIEEEIGDVLFIAANLARHYGVDAEEALRKANDKFSRRFQGMERDLVTEEKVMKNQSADDLYHLWQRQKRKEKKAGA